MNHADLEFQSNASSISKHKLGGPDEARQDMDQIDLQPNSLDKDLFDSRQGACQSLLKINFYKNFISQYSLCTKTIVLKKIFCGFLGNTDAANEATDDDTSEEIPETE